MSKLERAINAVRTPYQTLVKDLAAAIDTGNPEEGALVLAHADAAHLDDLTVSFSQRAELQADFVTAFPDFKL